MKQNTYFQKQISNYWNYLELERKAKPKKPTCSIIMSEEERKKCDEINEKMRLLRANDRAANDLDASTKKKEKVAAATLQVSRRKLKAALMKQIKGMAENTLVEEDISKDCAFEWLRYIFLNE